MTPVIRVENLSKFYRVTHEQHRAGYRTLRESLTNTALAPFRRWGKGASGVKQEEFWALRDVSFDVRPGEVLGIIGRNGAGKSTLLKILSRITKPSRGQVEMRGRVGSLLEVGTGFHPELTGRENIALCGAILGMRAHEIRRKFDEIVAFAGIERFLDTPVKRYSSGMYVRLAFAVAAHLEPEILLVDEVLAVGDQAFQKKCLGKMDSVARSGRTVFFVSHQLSTVEALCSRVLVLEKGSLVLDDKPAGAISYYLARLREDATHCTLAERTDRGGSGEALFTALRIYDGDGNLTNQVPCGSRLTFELDVTASRPVDNPQCAVIVSTARGQRLFRLHTGDGLEAPPPVQDMATYRCTVDALNLMPGSYSVLVRFFDGAEEILDEVDMATELTVLPLVVNGTGRIPGNKFDLVYMPFTWTFPVHDGVVPEPATIR
jgi:lipopolysaccharide transport system ATP-binding protein